MAGYTSTPRQYGEYIQPYNIDMIAKGLSYKETRHEAADNQLRERINQIGSLDILKDEDKSYLLSRLTSMVGDVNNVGALDLSDAGIVKNLDSHIQNSIDDNVLNAFQSTKQIRAFQESLQEIQKNNKELFNPLNVAYAMRPVQKYLQSGKVGENISDYGSLIYTPYTDIEGEISKQMDDYVKNMKDGKIKIVSEDGKSVYEKDVRGMDLSEIKNLVGSMVSSKYEQQATINAWQRYGRYSQEGLLRYKSDVADYINVKKNDYNTAITNLELQSTSVKDKGQDHSSIDAQIKNLKLEMDGLDSQAANMLRNPEAAGGLLEREGIVTRLTTRYNPLLKKLDDSFVGKNEVYYAEMENQFKQLDSEIKLEKLELDRQKNAREAEEFRLKASGQWRGGSGSSDGSSGNGGSNDKFNGIGVGTLETDVAQERDWEQETIDFISEKNKTVQDMTKQTYDYVVRESQAGNASATALLKDYNLKRKGKHSGAIFRQVYNAQASNLGLNLVEDSNGNQLFTMGDLSAEVEEYNTVASRYKSTKDNVLGSMYNSKVNESDFYKNIADEDSLMVATPTGLVNLKQLVIQRGVMDSNGNKIKNITDDAMINNTIKANLILGKMSPVGGSSGSLQQSFQRAVSSKDAYDLGTIYKENIQTLIKDGKVDMRELQRKAPRTYQALVNYETVSPNGDGLIASSDSFVGRFLSPNRRLLQDSVFRNISNEGMLSNDTLKEKYNQDLMAGLQGVGVDNAIVMTNPKNADFQRFAQQIAAFGRPGDNASQQLLDNITTDSIKEIKYRVRQENGEMRVQFKIEVPKQGITTHEVFLNVNDLQRNAPEFMSGLTFQQDSFYYSRKGMGKKAVKTSADGISFVNPNANFVYNSKLQTNLQNEFGSLPFYEAIVSGINKDDTRRFLSNQFKYQGNQVLYKDIISNTSLNAQQKQEAIKAQERNYLSVVDNILANASNYIMDAKFINDNQYALELKDKSGRTIAGMVQNGDNLKPLKKLFDNYESSAFTMFVSGLIEQEKLNIANGASDFSTSFKTLTGLK